jgi:hypothetical protein
MLLALMLAVAAADWVPARWFSAEPQSLELLRETPVNCLLLEPDQWTPALTEAAARQGLVTLGVVRPGGDPVETARQALGRKLNGIVLEGDFSEAAIGRVREMLAASEAPVIEMLPRRALRPAKAALVLATYQGVWPGIEVEENGAAKAGPTGSPWVNTNTGFYMYARSATAAPVWMGVVPPPKRLFRIEHYLQAVGDAALYGARWVVALDSDFRRRLVEREPAALRDWRRLAQHLQYFEDHPEWRRLPFYGGLSVVQDADSGALVSGSILDMIAAKHTPFRVVPRSKLSPESVRGSRIVLNLEAELLSAEQKQALASYTSGGGTLVTSPPGAPLPALREDRITTNEEEQKQIDELWRGINSMLNQTELGARLFHVTGVATSFLGAPGSQRIVIHLLNYTDYPIENIAIHFPGGFRQAKIMTPAGPVQELEMYRIDRNSAVDIDELAVCATVIVE